MARLPNQAMTPGTPEKPKGLSARASKEWDRLVSELTDAGIQVSRAHRALIASAATIAADIAEAWGVIEDEGAYILNEKTGATQAHPAAKRLDGLRRDHIKVMSLLGLRSATAGDKTEETLSDLIGE